MEALPAELRNRTYECLFSDPSPSASIEHCQNARSDHDILTISRVSKQFRRESLPFYWSCTPFHINHPGHRALSSYDEHFYLWLRDSVKASVKDIRRLQFTVKVPNVMPSRSEKGRDPSKAIINIDLGSSVMKDAVTVEGYYSGDQNLQILPYVRKAISNVPRVERKPVVSEEVLWDIYEACYFITRADVVQRRTWAEFTRAYELNRSKTNRRRWSEEVYHEMSQELVHGPAWRERLDNEKRRMMVFLECR